MLASGSTDFPPCGGEPASFAADAGNARAGGRWNAAAGDTWRRLGRWAWLVYLATALPCALALAALTPPFQAPDEPNHFRRIVEILDGSIVAYPGSIAGQSGAALPEGVARVADAFGYLPDHAEARYAPDVMRRAREAGWGGAKADQGFANTAIYPPFFYLPAVAALSLARRLGWGVMDSYRAARSANAVAAVLVAAAAIGLARRGKAVLFVVLSLPMALFLFASVSQDALLIAGTAFAVALCARMAEGGGGRSWPGRLAAAVLLGFAAAARPPYAFLLVVLAGPRPGAGGRALPRAAFDRGWPAALALGIGLAWVAFGAAPAQMPMRADAGVSIAGQLREMAAHPTLFPSALLNTLLPYLRVELEEMIGVLGWADLRLPEPYYPTAAVALALGAAMAAGGRLRRTWPWGCAVGLGMALAFVGVHGALYLSWTPVGSDVVEGFQGRYILPIATLAAAAVPAATARRPPRLGGPVGPGSGVAALRCAGWAALFAFAIAGDLWLPFVVFGRYYA